MEKKLPKLFWILIVASVCLFAGLLIALFLEKSPSSEAKPLPQIACEQKTNQAVKLSNPLRLVRWQNDQNTVLLSENDDRLLKEYRLVNSEKKSQVYESGSVTDLCKIYENCADAKIVDELRDDLVLIISRNKLIKKNEKKSEEKPEEKAESPRFSVLVKSANNKTIPLKYAHCANKGSFDGNWKSYFNLKDYQLSIVDQKTGLLITGNLNSLLKSIHKTDEAQLIAQNFVNGGFLDTKCTPDPVEMGQVLFSEEKMIIWLPKKNTVADILVTFAPGGFAEGWKREKDFSDIFKNESGYLAAISSYQNRILTSYFSTVTKKFENKTWEWAPLKLSFQSGFSSKYRQLYLQPELGSENLVSFSDDNNHEFYVSGKGLNTTYLIASKNFSDLGFQPKLAIYQNNRLFLLGDKKTNELSISRFECK